LLKAARFHQYFARGLILLGAVLFDRVGQALKTCIDLNDNPINPKRSK
jgi:hypothetical protein